MEQIDETKTGVQTAEPETKAEAKEPVETAEVMKLKAALSKANSEAAANKRLAEEFKQKLRDKQTEQEKQESDLAEQRKKELEELEELRKEKRINGYKAKLMEAGIDHVSADLMAKALPDGVADDYFTATKAVLADAKQKAVNDSLSKQPGLSVGTPPSGKTAAELEMEQLRKNIGL